MNKNLLYLLAFIALLPGCGGRKKGNAEKASGTVAIAREKDQEKKSGKKKLFLDDNVGQFEFEEEENAFSSAAMKESTLNLVAAPSAREWEERRAAQSKYGFKTVYFDFDQFKIRPDQKAVLKHDAAIIKKLTQQGHTIIIEGHACNSAGSEPYNLQLSEKRADAVKKHLVKQGVPAKSIKIVGRGFEMCIVSVGTREQQEPNRRVEFHVEIE